MVFLFVYIFFFNMIYSFVNECLVYLNMDWFKVFGFGVLWLFGFVFVIVFLVYLLVFGFYWFREIIDEKCCKKGLVDFV